MMTDTQSEPVATCVATVRGGRIELDIQKGDRGYELFAAVLDGLEAHEAMSWYGDIKSIHGHERSGLVLSTKTPRGV